MANPIDRIAAFLNAGAVLGGPGTTDARPKAKNVGKLARLAMLIAAGCVALHSAGGALAAEQTFRYHYVVLDSAVPPGFAFFDPAKITDDGRVYGAAYACGSFPCQPSVAVYRNGAMTILHEGVPNDANNAGTVGGYVILDPDFNHFVTQAALFRGSTVELIPPRPNEYSSTVIRLTDSGIALVQTVDSSSSATSYYFYRLGHIIPLNFGRHVMDLDVNNLGVISGSANVLLNLSAFRFLLPSTTTLLAPVSGDPNSIAQGIAKNGDVLGYSFGSGRTEQIGYWHGKLFKIIFIEGTSQYPTVSNHLHWNGNDLIVITDTTDLNSYLVPRPGVRLNLADLTDTLPTWTHMFSINARGDMVGWGGPAENQIDASFLLQRLPEGPGAVANWKPHAFPLPAAYPGRLASHGGLPGHIEASLFGDTGMRRHR